MTEIMKRLFERTKIDDNGCWIWQEGKATDGYGQTRIGADTTRLVHRIMYREAYGDFDRKMLICHKCDTPACCNPDHLFIGTNSDNVRDAANKGRMAKGKKNGCYIHPEKVPRGTTNGMSVLTEDKVIEIRNRYAKGDISQLNLGKLYGVSEHTIWTIVHRKTWKHVK
jgi:hypothetical protein